MLRHRKVPVAYPNALPGTCKHCGKPTGNNRTRSHETCREKYSQKVSYREAAARREGKYQRCVDCKMVEGEWRKYNGKPERVKITRDHVIALARNGPHDWHAPRCTRCHQKKSGEDNRKTQQMKDARRAPRRPRDRRNMSGTQNRKPRARTSSAHSGVGVLVRVLLSAALIGSALAMMTGILPNPRALDWRALLQLGLRALIGLVIAVAGIVALYLAARWVRRARQDAILRLTDMIARKMNADPVQISIKVKRWTRHQIPVTARAWYPGHFRDDDPAERAGVEQVISHKLGLNLDFTWTPNRDTVRWKPAVNQPLPVPDQQPGDDPQTPPEQTAEELAAGTIDRLQLGIQSVLGQDVAVEVTDWHTVPDDLWPGGHRRTTPQSITITYPASAKVHDEKTVDAVEDKMDSLLPGRWRAVWDTKNDRVVFTDTPDPLAQVVTKLPLADGAPVGRPALGQLEDGSLWQIPFEKETPHLLVAGASGAGKGSVLWSLTRSLMPGVLAGTAMIWGIDPKGIELARGQGIFRKYTASVDGAIRMLDDVLEFIETRKARMRAAKLRDFTPSPGDPRLFIMIDEIAALTLYGVDAKTAKLVINKLGLIVTQGRALGVHLIGALQDPRKEVLKIRDLFAGKIALRLGSASECDLVLGAGSRSAGARADKIPMDMPGIAYLMIDGKPEPLRGRAGWVDDAEIERMEAAVIAAKEAGTIPMQVTPSSRHAVSSGQQPRAIDRPRRRRGPKRHRPLWNLVPVDDLRDSDVIILELDGVVTEVEMEGRPVESPDDEQYVEIAWKAVGGRSGVASIEASSMIERRPA